MRQFGVAALGKGATIPCGLRLALAHLGGSEIREIRWNGVQGWPHRRQWIGFGHREPAIGSSKGLKQREIRNSGSKGWLGEPTVHPATF